MKAKLINLTLPEWAWLSGGEHEKGGDPLAGRNIVLHVRSASVVEFLQEGAFKAAPGVKTYNFIYRNIAGINERHVAVLHYSAACDDEETLDEILKRASQWFCDYMKWEDRNIAAEDSAPLN